jgi:hypothetical protein
MLQISKAWFASAVALSSVLPFLRRGDAGRPKAVVPSPVAMPAVTSTIYYCYARVCGDFAIRPAITDLISKSYFRALAGTATRRQSQLANLPAHYRVDDQPADALM